MQAAVVVFPGSNCDRDIKVALEAVAGKPVAWSGTQIRPCPTLRSHRAAGRLRLWRLPALRRHGRALAGHARRGRQGQGGHAVLGICNGFQVLTEAGLLPGVLMRNASLKFVCRDVHLKVEHPIRSSPARYRQGEVIRIPIAHGDGNYFADEGDAGRARGRGSRRLPLRRQDGSHRRRQPQWRTTQHRRHLRRSRRILGMMPHPERLFEPHARRQRWPPLFESLLATLH